MDIEFDPAKDVSNRAKHGVSLQQAAEFDMSGAVVERDVRRDYGEARYRAFGRIDGIGYCLAFTFKEGTVRIISFRRAHEKEMRRHGR
jgi:uncharacterized protein